MKFSARHSSSSMRSTRSAKSRNEGTKDNYPSYHDFCTLSLSHVEELTSTADQARYRGGKKSTFPRALYDLLLESETNYEYEDIVSWQPHGRSFLVKDKVRFERDILPHHFGCQSSFASFQRQLNVYGFLRMTKAGADRKSYYHELFLRGRPDLLSLMPRKRNTTAPVRRSLDPSTEPNLYHYPPSLPEQYKKETVASELVTSTPAAPQPVVMDPVPLCSPSCSPSPPPRTISTDMERLLSDEAILNNNSLSISPKSSSEHPSSMIQQQPHSPGSLHSEYSGGLVIPSTFLSTFSAPTQPSSIVWTWDAGSVTPDISWQGDEGDDAMAEFLDEVDLVGLNDDTGTTPIM